jgi:hypothetical protein
MFPRGGVPSDNDVFHQIQFPFRRLLIFLPGAAVQPCGTALCRFIEQHFSLDD